MVSDSNCNFLGFAGLLIQLAVGILSFMSLFGKKNPLITQSKAISRKTKKKMVHLLHGFHETGMWGLLGACM
jgi:hypothetical protein